MAQGSLQLLITVLAPSTMVTVTVEGTVFQRVLTLHQGEMWTFQASTEMVGTGLFNRMVLVVIDQWSPSSQ